MSTLEKPVHKEVYMAEACILPDYQNIPSEIWSYLKDIKTIAIVGASPKPERPSHQVMAYLLDQGFRVIPVNPGQEEILGQTCYPSLASIPEEISVDTVLIFRRPDQVLPIVEEALRRGVKLIWMQEGVVNEEAAQKVREAGRRVVMNLCLKKIHQLAQRHAN